MELTQKQIELTGCIIADTIEEIINDNKAVKIRSKAFDTEAPGGEKLQVQIVVVGLETDFLPDNIDSVTYYIAE